LQECYLKLKSDGTMWIVVDSQINGQGGMLLLPNDISDISEDIGFRHLDTIVWYKPTSLGGMNPKLLANKKEYVLFLSKTEVPKYHRDIRLENDVEDPAISEGKELGNIWRFPVKRGSIGGNNLHKAPFPIPLIKRMLRLTSDEGDDVLDPFLGSGSTACAALQLRRRVWGYELNPEFKPIIEDRLSDISGENLKISVNPNLH